MSSKPMRARWLESAISICLLAILVLIAVGIFLKQSDADMARFGIDATTAGLLTQKKEETALGPLAPSGFEALSGTQTYTADNLYEKINGKADFYLDSGFKKLSTQRFISKDDNSLWFELYVYDMATNKNAFSVFSVQRRADAVISGLLDPQYAYRTTNALYCVNGHYYIELIGSAESNELFKAMVEARNRLRKKLAVDMVTEITELRFFPPDNIVPGSIKFYLADAFGFERLTDTFTARYKLDDEIITAFFSRRPDPQNARTVAESYLDFLVDNDGKITPAINKFFESRVVVFHYSNYDEFEVVFPSGPFVLGIHEAKNQQTAEKLAEMFVKRLNEVIDSAGNE